MTNARSWSGLTSVLSRLRQDVPARWRITILLLILGAIIVRVTMLDDSWLHLMLVGGDPMGLVAREHDARLKAKSAESLQGAVESSDSSAKKVKP